MNGKISSRNDGLEQNGLKSLLNISGERCNQISGNKNGTFLHHKESFNGIAERCSADNVILQQSLHCSHNHKPQHYQNNQQQSQPAAFSLQSQSCIHSLPLSSQSLSIRKTDDAAKIPQPISFLNLPPNNFFHSSVSLSSHINKQESRKYKLPESFDVNKIENTSNQLTFTSSSDMEEIHYSKISQHKQVFNQRYQNVRQFPNYKKRTRLSYEKKLKRSGIELDGERTISNLRQFLQPIIHKEIEGIIEQYVNKYFMKAFTNIQENICLSSSNWSQSLKCSIIKSVYEKLCAEAQISPFNPEVANVSDFYYFPNNSNSAFGTISNSNVIQSHGATCPTTTTTNSNSTTTFETANKCSEKVSLKQESQYNSAPFKCSSLTKETKIVSAPNTTAKNTDKFNDSNNRSVSINNNNNNSSHNINNVHKKQSDRYLQLPNGICTITLSNNTNNNTNNNINNNNNNNNKNNNNNNFPSDIYIYDKNADQNIYNNNNNSNKNNNHVDTHDDRHGSDVTNITENRHQFQYQTNSTKNCFEEMTIKDHQKIVDKSKPVQRTYTTVVGCSNGSAQTNHKTIECLTVSNGPNSHSQSNTTSDSDELLLFPRSKSVTFNKKPNSTNKRGHEYISDLRATENTPKTSRQGSTKPCEYYSRNGDTKTSFDTHQSLLKSKSTVPSYKFSLNKSYSCSSATTAATAATMAPPSLLLQSGTAVETNNHYLIPNSTTAVKANSIAFASLNNGHSI